MEIANNEHYSLSVDTVKNRLYIKCIGFWGEESIVDSYMRDQQTAASKLRKGFTVVADMIEYKTLPQHLIEKQKRSQADLANAGLARVATLLPQSVIASMQLKKVTKTTEMAERHFSSRKEAEEWLDQK